jgi:hypothetical protein
LTIAGPGQRRLSSWNASGSPRANRTHRPALLSRHSETSFVVRKCTHGNPSESLDRKSLPKCKHPRRHGRFL